MRIDDTYRVSIKHIDDTYRIDIGKRYRPLVTTLWLQLVIFSWKMDNISIDSNLPITQTGKSEETLQYDANEVLSRSHYCANNVLQGHGDGQLQDTRALYRCGIYRPYRCRPLGN